jgi:hypothetical protein
LQSSLAPAEAPDAAAKDQNKLGCLAALVTAVSGQGIPDWSRYSIHSRPATWSALYIGCQPTPNGIAVFSVENLLNVDSANDMCCSTAAGHVVPSPGIAFKGSLTIRCGVRSDS